MKPFDLTAAKAGAPVRLSDGTESVRIICWDRKGNNPPIVALIGHNETAWCFNADGRISNGHADGTRLVMASIGTLDGREVYPGDTVMDAGGPLTVGNDWTQSDLDQCTSPRVYPKTRMSDDELLRAWNDSHFNGTGAMMDLANAAIAHGIERGYLAQPLHMTSDHELMTAFYNGIHAPMPPESYDKMLEQLRRVRDTVFKKH